MRVETINISGFKSIPFCAKLIGRDNRTFDVQWDTNNLFQIKLPVSSKESFMLSTIIGANSSGKSNILCALEAFFSNKSKLSLDCFNEKVETEPIIIELKLVDAKDKLENILQKNEMLDFAQKYCHLLENYYYLTVGLVWPLPEKAGQFYYIRKTDNSCPKISSSQEKNLLLKEIFPKYRLIRADGRLCDEANPTKNDLLEELINDVLVSADPSDKKRRNAIVRIRKKLEELESLVKRTGDTNAWGVLQTLEEQLSTSLSKVTPGNTAITIDICDSIPTLKEIFRKSNIKILDGIELGFDKQGLGLQRSFVLALLKTWCVRIAEKTKEQNYLFAIEEPEIYLHPHATRVMLDTLQSIAKLHQVVFTTHSSEFVNRVPLENIILMRRTNTVSKVQLPDFSTLPHKSDLYKVSRHLQESRSDMLFARSVLLVEGQSEWYALPEFAQKLSITLDDFGVSIVCAFSKDNFRTYHLILREFNIPHIILGDGDGARASKERRYTSSPFLLSLDNVFILDYDFERELSAHLSDTILCQIINRARKEIGKNQLTPKEILTIPQGQIKEKFLAKKLQKLGKPLIGRIVGELLKKRNIQQLTHIEDALNRALNIAL